MVERLLEPDNIFQTAHDISEAISKSKEVVNQSKTLWNKIRNTTNKQSWHREYRSLEQSFSDTSHLSPTIRGNEAETHYRKENSILQNRIFEMQKEINSLKEKVKSQDVLIESYEKKLLIQKSDKKTADLNILETESEMNEKSSEERLKEISEKYNQQVKLHFKLKKKIQELNESEEKKIKDLEGKILVSNKKLKTLVKRLEKTEDILSANPTPLTVKSRKSCGMIPVKVKNNPRLP